MEASSRTPVIERLRSAIDAHDLEALVGCFAPDYRSTFPAHPQRAFQGQDQVRKNWSRIFGGIPDIRAEILRQATAGDTHWGEWRWFGTQTDGTPQEMRGVIIFGIEEDRITWGRLYMEPLEVEGEGIDRTVEQMTSTPSQQRKGAQP